ncbi:hypothetical protein [Flavobacterium sp. NRK1]|uniref:hypothetical protein n=1 Tax=Flavobacterium sp. NRK1 TaxID=2954929 RepID=UPI0020938C11|nr:hypothetical protein [Flavobacterium sp. NRK1]MCO6147878.1 hypothetical protein [Flavobacterium sp. NRK1]
MVINVIIIGCNTNEPKPLKLSKYNRQKLLKSGEWISNKDSMSGISIRANKFVFFNKMKFSTKNVYEYEMIDSIYKFSNREDKVGQYILLRGLKDTIYYKIINKTDNSLILKINNKNQTFNLKIN